MTFDPKHYIDEMLTGAYESAHAYALAVAPDDLDNRPWLERTCDHICHKIVLSVVQCPQLDEDRIGQAIYASAFSGFQAAVKLIREGDSDEDLQALAGVDLNREEMLGHISKLEARIRRLERWAWGDTPPETLPPLEWFEANTARKNGTSTAANG